jgi:hypothetical protein
MSSLLIPVSVVAKIIKAKTAVPSLSGAPFNTDLSLEAGIHVHWALPDALTRARHTGDDPSKKIPPQQTLFPGVPDLWLVTRFNPPAAGVTQRTWKAWVVDSRNKTVTPLDHWSAPAAPDPKTIHTFPGMLPASSDSPGWGVWDHSQTEFDAAFTAAVYYPTARTRFGFYDDLSGLPATGSVSYTVIGWYSSLAGDPLYNASDREGQIKNWALSYDHHRSIIDIIPAVAAQTPASTWKPQLTVQPAAQPQHITATTQLKATLQDTAVRQNKMQVIQTALGKAAAGLVVSQGPVFRDVRPSQIVCHGSVLDAPLNGTPTSASIATSQIAVYPTTKRAMAALTAPHVSDQQLDYAEMLLQDLDHQKGSVGGVIDMPGAAHALTFQSIPGKAVYYASMTISDPKRQIVQASQAQFTLQSASAMMASGHWPDTFSANALSMTSASLSQVARLSGLVQQAPPFQAAPPQPTQDQINAWLKQVRDAMNKTIADAAAAGTPIDPKMIRVIDSRAKAQPLRLAPQVDGSGTSGGGYWVNIDDTDSLTQILVATTGASVSQPDAGSLYTEPGPRWYRPWSPQIVLTDAKRSYRFGEDGQFEANGTLKCRTSGYTAYAIYSNTGTQVQGSALIANSAGFTSVAGLPSDTQALLNESVMLDTGSSPALAAVAPAAQRAAAQSYFTAAIQGVYLQRFSNLSAATVAALGKIQVQGTQPSPMALTPWQDPYDPLYLDTNYSLLRSSLENDWQLEEDKVEMTPKTPAATNPPASQAEVFSERSRVTASITKVLQSALVTRTSLNPIGVTVLRQNAPNGLTQQVFQTMDVLSAPLTGFDATLFSRGDRERDGVLQVNKLSLVDVFGTTRQWNSANAAGPSTPLLPRLPFWARLSFRLQSAADQNVEANSYTPAICGILLPDFLDHALQVFDGSGNSIGELSSDRPQYGGGPTDKGATLQVKFATYPWIAAPGGDPLNAIANPILREVVAGIAVQSAVIPAAASASTWFESGLTAMLRSIDTVRATLDPSHSTPDHKVSLIGEPILVMVGRVKFETTAETDRKKIAQGPAPLATPPAIPKIQVRIGDITRPDDGVLGFFQPNDSPANSRFAPVSKDAAEHAIINGLTAGLPFNLPNGLAVNHPFVKNQVNAITVTADTPQDVILLTDIRGDLYATCGVLPRKSITVPKDFLDAAIKNMEPVFGVGPIFTVGATQDVKPLFPPPQVTGYDASYVYAAAPGAPDAFPETPLPPSAPIGDLAPDRVTLNEGWVRLELHKK